MAIDIQVTEEELKIAFSDTLGKGASFAGIVVAYQDGEGTRTIRTEIGFPYDIINGELEIGPYFKNIVTSPPDDYHRRKKRIPISAIKGYKRLELSDLAF